MVRCLRPDEVDAYRTIRLEALQRDPEAFGSAFELEASRPIEHFSEQLRNNAVFVAQGDDLIGVAGFARLNGPKIQHKGFLWGMYVRPSCRSMGVGAALLTAAIEHAREQVEIIQLTVVAINEPARRLYTLMGFVEYGRQERALKHGHRYFDEVLMMKSLR